MQYEDPHGRLRFWESAERLSRHGDVDGVAIITLVSPRMGTCPCLGSRVVPSIGDEFCDLHKIQNLVVRGDCFVGLYWQVRSKQEPLKVILEAQFRPSQGNMVIEVSITSIQHCIFP